MPAETELAIGAVSAPSWERWLCDVRNVTGSDIVLLRSCLDSGLLELLVFCPSSNKFGFGKDSFPLFKPADCFPTPAGVHKGALTQEQLIQYAPGCRDFLKWLREKAWFPLFTHNKHMVILASGEDACCSLKDGSVLYAWLTTQYEASKFTHGVMHDYFLSLFNSLDLLSTAESTEKTLSGLAFLLANSAPAYVRSSAVFEHVQGNLELLSAFTGDSAFRSSEKNISDRLKIILNSDDIANDFFGERTFETKMVFPNEDDLKCSFGCLEQEFVCREVLDSIFEGMQPSNCSQGIQDSDSWSITEFLFEIEGRQFALASEIHADLSEIEANFARSTILGIAAQARVIIRDRLPMSVELHQA